MKKNQVIDLGLTGYDELFMNDQERADIRKPKVEEIPLTELTPFKDHPFKVKNDEEMVELMKSIADSGVLAPALARPKEGGTIPAENHMVNTRKKLKVFRNRSRFLLKA